MTAIKAIETSYKGYRFRSRLEARWAVFFDAVGAKWEYEKEGFELPSGRYLPDFWLPDLECWLEVKGVEPTESELRIAAELGSVGYAVVIAWGLPLENGLLVYCADCTDSSGGEGWWSDMSSCESQFSLSEGGLCIWSGDNRADRAFLGPTWEQSFAGMKLNRDCIGQPNSASSACALLERYGNAARSARFEHGESPKV